MSTNAVCCRAARLAVALFLALGAVPAAGVPWFPSVPGPQFAYQNGIAPVSIVALGDAEFCRSSCMDRWPFICSAEYFRIGDDGDVLLTAVGGSATGLIDIYRYDPPLKYLDFPLTTGNTWTSQAELLDYNEDVTLVTLSGRVHGPGVISVPAGTFEIILVELTFEGPVSGSAPTTGFLFLHQQLGPVGGLVSWSGVVGTDPISWGRLKSTWR